MEARPKAGWLVLATRWLKTLRGRLFRRANPFDGGASRSTARAASEKQPLLRLDTVHVVRNDLSDSDFEVVKARRRPVAAGPVAVPAAPAVSDPAPALKLEFEGLEKADGAEKRAALAQMGRRGA